MPSVINGNDGFSTVDNGIETVTNTNGTAIKYPDGTMICYFLDSVNVNTTTVKGAIYAGASKTFNFPVAFIEAPMVSSASQNRGWDCFATCGQPSATQVALVPISYSVNGTCKLGYQAIGRWK